MAISDANAGVRQLVSDERPAQNTSTPAHGQSSVYQEFVQNFYARLSAAVALKNYAVDNNLEIDATAVQSLNALCGKINGLDSLGQGAPIPMESPITPDDMTALDKSISSITRITYPLTVDNVTQIMRTRAKMPREFRILLMAGGIIGVAGAIFFVLGLTYRWWPVFLTSSLLAICFGFLGAVVYGFFNVLKITPGTHYTDYDRYDNYARLVLGILLGWVFYFAFVQPDFTAIATPGNDSAATKLTILLPFLAGYSTALVVSLLNKVITAAQLTLGLDDRAPGGGSGVPSGGE